MEDHVRIPGSVSKVKLKNRVNQETSIISAFEETKKEQSWSKNTLSTYQRNIQSLTMFLEGIGVAPTLENIDYEMGHKWVNYLYKEGKKAKTIKNMVASVSSLLSFLRDFGVIDLNPFIRIEISVDDEGHHSRVMLFEELYQIYSLINNPSFEGICLPVYIAMFNGSRNVNLCKLKMESFVASQMELQYGLTEKSGEEEEEIIGKRNNRKNKLYATPVPPRLMAKIQEQISSYQLKEGDALLYGTTGKPLANKQFNYIVKQLCQELGWVRVEKKISPHAFRYTYATLLAEMGVSDEAIRYGLGHSEHNKGSLDRYLHLNHRYKKQLQTAQTVLEDIFEALKKLEENHMLTYIDMKQIHEELPDVYQRQLRNGGNITLYVNSIFERANSLWRNSVMKPTSSYAQGTHQNPYGYSPQEPNQQPYGLAPQFINSPNGYQQPGTHLFPNPYMQPGPYQNPSMVYYQAQTQHYGGNMNPIQYDHANYNHMNHNQYPPAMNQYSAAHQDWNGILPPGVQLNHVSQGNYQQSASYSGSEVPGHLDPDRDGTHIKEMVHHQHPIPLIGSQNGYIQPNQSAVLTQPVFKAPSQGFPVEESPNGYIQDSLQAHNPHSTNVKITGFMKGEQHKEA